MTYLFPPPRPPSVSLWVIAAHLAITSIALAAAFGVFRKSERVDRQPEQGEDGLIDFVGIEIHLAPPILSATRRAF